MCAKSFRDSAVERIRLQCRRPGFDPWVGEIPWRRERLPAPVFWPGKFHELYGTWGHKESDTTETLSLSSHFSRVQLFATYRLAHQAPLPMGLSWQEYWSGPPLGDLPDPGIEPGSPVSPALQADSLMVNHLGSLKPVWPLLNLITTAETLHIS